MFLEFKDNLTCILPGVKLLCESLMEMAVQEVPEFPPQTRSLGAIVEDASFQFDGAPVFRVGDHTSQTVACSYCS